MFYRLIGLASLLAIITIPLMHSAKVRGQGEAAEKKAETETELAVLKSALEGNDLEAIKAATEKVATVSQSLGAALYAATAAAEGAATPNEDGVEDAEIVEEGK